jgi:hypothetical protein
MMASVMTRSEMKKLDGITEEINNVLKKHSAKLFAGVLDCGHGDMEFRLRLVMEGCEYDITKDINNHDLTSDVADKLKTGEGNHEQKEVVLKIYETNAGLGCNQLAYLLKVSEGAYLCIGISGNVPTVNFEVGTMEYDLEDYYLASTTFTISKSPLHPSFMFDYVLKALNDNRLAMLGTDKPKDLEGLCWACVRQKQN